MTSVPTAVAYIPLINMGVTGIIGPDLPALKSCPACCAKDTLESIGYGYQWWCNRCGCKIFKESKVEHSCTERELIATTTMRYQVIKPTLWAEKLDNLKLFQ